MPAQHPERLQITRAEWLWLAAAILLGSVLRLSFPGRIAVEHFDEGVYASNFWFGEEYGYRYPAQHLYAPPLLPLAIEWTMVGASLAGVSLTGFVPTIPCFIAGLTTIPSAWWIGRRWFGPTAGIVSAWLIASSDFHSSYSRAALTDVLVSFFILWSVYFGSRALHSGAIRHAVIAGLFTTVAWWTKYSGWLPVAIILAGGAAWQLTINPAERRAARFGSRWLVIAVSAFVGWTPVLVGLRQDGGYAAVAANHRQYIVGLQGWARSAFRQLTNAGMYDHWLTFIVPDADHLGQLLISPTPIALLTVSILGCVGWLVRHWRTTETLPAWLLAAWICGLSASIPFYHPYPRLMLPWLIAVWMGGGLAVEMLVRGASRRTCATGAGRVAWKPHWIVMAFSGCLLICTVTRCATGRSLAWQDRSGLAREVARIATEIKARTQAAGFPGDEAIVYVFGEPAVVFALKANGLALVSPIQSLGFVDSPRVRPTFLVHSDRALRSTAFREEWSAKQGDFEPVAAPTVQLSHLVVLDEDDDLQELERRLKHGDTLWINRVR